MAGRPTLVSVMTAGDVGAIQPRLGVSSFDVKSAVSTPSDLIIELETVGPPDVIIIESALFPSVEPVVQLAPDALIIAVGDETPPGAIGHIPAGMSGGAIAGLVHALLAGGVAVAAAAFPSFQPAPAPTGPSAAALSASRGSRVASLVTTGVVTTMLAAVVAWGLVNDRTGPVNVAAPTAPAEPQTTPGPSVDEPEPTRSEPTRREPKERPAPERAAPAAERTAAPEPPSAAPQPQPEPEPPTEAPPPTQPSPTDEREPRGKHLGWEHKPPKHEDHGKHGGWE